LTIQLAWDPGPQVPRDVWLAFGDSMTDGRGDIAEAPAGYVPNDGTLWMCKTAAAGQVQLAEPCGQAANANAGVGPWGMFGWLVAQETGRETLVINTGVGGSTSSQWVPGQANYANALGRLQRVMSRREMTLRGFLIYMGPNDAVSATPSWRANVVSSLAGFRAWAGKTPAECPAIISRLTAHVPTDVAYPGWAHVQAEIVAIEDADHLVITPPSPADREAYNLHHKTGQNYTIAQSALTAAMSHASWG